MNPVQNNNQIVQTAFAGSKSKYSEALLISPQRDSAMKKLVKPALLLTAIAVMVIGMLGSGAWFTDTKNTPTGTIKAGTLILDSAGFEQFDLGTVTANMAPGDEAQAVTIEIKNAGTLNLAWIGDLQVSNSILKDVIYIKNAKMEFKAPNSGADWNVVDNFFQNGIGYTKLGANTYGTITNFNDAGTMIPNSAYDFMGALKPGYSYRLTLQFAFDENAGNSYQNAGPMNIGLKFVATQINLKALQSVEPMINTGMVDWFDKQIAKQP